MSKTTRASLGQAWSEPGQAAAGRAHGPLERVTVNLTPRSAKALEEVVQITQDTKTDVINRALQVYAFLEKIMHDGRAVYIREAESTDLERLKFFRALAAATSRPTPREAGGDRHSRWSTRISTRAVSLLERAIEIGHALPE